MCNECASMCMWCLDAEEERHRLVDGISDEMLQKCHIHWQQKIKNIEIRQRLGIKKNVMQLIMERKLNLFGHICRMDDNRLMKNVVFRIVKGQNKRGRPSREWMDKEWCRTGGHTLNIMVQDESELSLRHLTPNWHKSWNEEEDKKIATIHKVWQVE